MSRSFRLLLHTTALCLCWTSVQAQQAHPQDMPPQNLPLTLPMGESLSGSYLAGRHAGALRDTAAAAVYFSESLERDPENTELVARAFVLRLAAGDIANIAPLARHVLTLDSRDRLARLVLAARFLHEHKYTQARDSLRLSEKGALADITGALLGAWALDGAGEPARALALLDRLQGAEWYAIFRDLHAGLIAERNGRKDEAFKRLNAAYQADGSALRVMEAFARHLARKGEREMAAGVVRQFLARLPDNPIAKALLEEVTTKEKDKIALMVSSPAMGGGEVLFGLGAALARDGGDDLATIYLQLALYLDPANALTLISLADLYEQQKQPTKMVSVLERVTATSPMKRGAEIQLALVLEEMGRTDDALKHIDGILVAYPTDIDAWTARGNILRVKKRFLEASAAYSKAIELVGKPDRRHWTLFYFRGMSYERDKHWAKAEPDFKQALDLQPEQPLVLNYLGYSWVDQGIHLDDAMAMLKRAVEQRKDDGYIIDSVGWAYYRTGNYAEAVTWLERAVEKKASDPTLSDHLGDAYWRVGRPLEAKFLWAQARDLKPEADELAKIEQKLKDGLPDAAPKSH